MADLGKAYVQIIPKAEGITSKMNSLLGGAGKSAGAKAGKEAGGAAGSGLLSGMKKALTAAAIGAPIIAGVKAALDEGGKLQQSFGGLETIYGEAAESAKDYAKNAAQIGISANDYAEQAVSFGASLKQAFGGDSEKAVEAANTAITDMTDNAAKMGTPLESIQNAYSGFAKQNYTMLDNLKLGYGGTKEEMERLLQDASKLSGKEYDIGNLGDVYDAIHVIQGDLGLTGVAADEAANTFQGSFGAMKAAASNFFGSLTTGGDVAGTLSTLIDSAITFVGNNLLPMLGEMFTALPGALQTVATEYGPQAAQALGGLFQSIIDYAPTALAGLGEKITGVFEFIDKNSLIDKGIQMIGGFADGILDGVPGVLSNVGSMISTAITFIVENLPEFVQKGAEIIGGIVQGIGEHLPEIGQAALDLIVQIVTSIGENLPQLVESGMTMLGQIQAGILNALPQLPGTIAEGVSSAAQAVVDTFSQTDWGAIGQNLLSGIANGISSYVNLIAPAVKGIVSAIDNALQFTATINKVKAAFGKIKSSIKEALDKAKETVKSAIEKIKGIFPLSIGKIFSNLQLPHISVSAGRPPYGIGGLGEKPTFGITWNKKAMLEPYMFGNATLFGAGEAGDEILYGRGALMQDISTAIADGGGGNTFNVTLNASTDESPEEYADRFYREMKRVVRMGM
jgi:hypothetical protein